MKLGDLVHSDPEAYVQLLREAFPRHPLTNKPICCWCGNYRLGAYAVCRTCWKRIPRALQLEYLRLDLEDRAHWILNNRDTLGHLRASA